MKLRILLTCSLILCAAAASAQGRRGGAAGPVPPAPRWPDGTINLGAVPGQSGLWDGGEPLATNPRNYETVGGRPRPGLIDLKDVPLQPWAKALLDERHARFLADEPYTRCKPRPPHDPSGLRTESNSSTLLAAVGFISFRPAARIPIEWCT